MAQETASATTDPIEPSGQQDAAVGSAAEAVTDGQEAPGTSTTTDAGNVEDVYDKAFREILSPDAADSDADSSNEQVAEADKAKTDAPAPPQLSDDQTQLLRRLHMTPEMIADWSPEQKQQFLENAAKREADNTRTFKRLKEQLEGKGKGDGEGDGGDDKGAGQQTQTQETPGASELATEAQKVVDDLVEVYGDEMKPLGEFTGKLVGVVTQLQQRLEQTAGSSGVQNQLIVEMTIDSGIRDLISDFPTLEKADARQKVVQRFEDDWRSANSRHRSASGPLLQRVRAALRDAAAAEFGQVTETAAQVALANKTKDRLRGQPQAGSGRGRRTAMSEDDVYDQAFEEHLAPEVRR